MFGNYDIPLKIKKNEISISMEKVGDVYVYKRECLNEKVEKFILGKKSKILINPVEPLYTPKEITPNLLIEFDRAIVIEPKVTRKIYLKFPIEIGIFISKKREFEILDYFTLAKKKFTLYGDPKSGVVCKYWKSKVYPSIPQIDYLCEGVIELQIANSNSRWIKVTKSIFSAYGMKIYYKKNMVSMKAEMRVENEMNAEVDFIDIPLDKGMEKSIELFTTKKLPIVTAKFVMREGL